ncbi:MAG: MotA/TolQ/ExbB proton channel family protein [Bdellovibrionales bacterium]|nr:MotA/TolQ/ExbB proton channel family protein [Bdellovibrionales bacterium]
MESIFKFIVDSGFAGFVILALGLFGLVLVVERVKFLFKDSSLDAELFLNQVKSLVREDKVEEAVNFCAANDRSPVAYVTRAILQRSDRGSRAMEEAQDIAVNDMIPTMTKNLGYLTMIANVSTLVGLLGTIQGLILSFKAVAHADPAQKQVLLADGISLAMNTTALGLSVAIPVMVVYAILHSKQGKLFEQISRVSGWVIEEIKSKDLAPFGDESVFKTNLGQESGLRANMPQSPSKKRPAA